MSPMSCMLHNTPMVRSRHALPELVGVSFPVAWVLHECYTQACASSLSSCCWFLNLLTLAFTVPSLIPVIFEI